MAVLADVVENRASQTHHGLWCAVALPVAAVWTAVGFALAASQGQSHAFIQEWWRLQAVPLLLLGTWLLLTIRSGVFRARVRRLTVDGAVSLGLVGHPGFQIAVVALIAAPGTASLVWLGFSGDGLVRYFMWLTCAAICTTAALITLHVIEIIAVIRALESVPIKIFRYSPARTPELRAVVGYFSTFTLLTSLGYAFAFIATMRGTWMGSPQHVEVVRLFWPVIYVPICSLALVYPHLVLHRVIQREKEQTLLSCQRDIDDLLAKYSLLKTDDINRTNTIAQLFDRITATPDYVLDFGIVVRTGLPLLLNVATFVAKLALDYRVL